LAASSKIAANPPFPSLVLDCLIRSMPMAAEALPHHCVLVQRESEFSCSTISYYQ
jgi:predicted aminopeptidase